MMGMFLFFILSFSFAYDDPTGGKPFGPWLYKEQIKPMVKEAGELKHLTLVAGAVAGTFAVQPFDHRVRAHRNEHRDLILGKQESHVVSDLTNSWLQVGTSLLLIGVDTAEGVKLSRTLIFTSLSYSILKGVTNRERPDGSNHSSWPSGHTASMFAFAGSLSGSYGVSAAIPAYSAATLVALSRIRENKHWLSDIVGGAFIGTYWARVSYSIDDKSTMSLIPIPMNDGMMIVFNKPF